MVELYENYWTEWFVSNYQIKMCSLEMLLAYKYKYLYIRLISGSYFSHWESHQKKKFTHDSFFCILTTYYYSKASLLFYLLFFFQMESNNNCCHMNKQVILNLQHNITQAIICLTQLLTASNLLTNKIIWFLSIKPPSLHSAETSQLPR